MLSGRSRGAWLPAFVFLLPNLVSIGLFTLIPGNGGFFPQFHQLGHAVGPQWGGTR